MISRSKYASLFSLLLLISFLNSCQQRSKSTFESYTVKTDTLEFEGKHTLIENDSNHLSSDSTDGSSKNTQLSISINGYDLFQVRNEERLFEKLGKPNSIDIDGPFLIGDYAYRSFNYFYGENNIVFHGDEIFDFELNNSNFDVNGIRVGDSINKVHETFDHIDVREKKLYVYHTNGSFLSFEFDSVNIIRQVSLHTGM